MQEVYVGGLSFEANSARPYLKITKAKRAEVVA
jgi:hypothetical protein